MQYIFRLFQLGKPEASVDQYAPVLRAAFDELETAPEPPESVDPFEDRDSIIEYLRQQSALFERINARRLELEALRPDHRLSRVHEETVKFFRATLKVMNIQSESMNYLFQGNLAMSRRKGAEAQSWAGTLNDILVKMGKCLCDLRNAQPTLYSMLDLPSALLEDLGVETPEPVVPLEDTKPMETREVVEPEDMSATIQGLLDEVMSPEGNVPGVLVEVIVDELASFGDDAIPDLVAALRHRSHTVRFVAATALGKIGPAAAPALIQASRDSNENVRLATIHGLGQLGTLGAKRLAEMHFDPSMTVQSAAAKAFE